MVMLLQVLAVPPGGSDEHHSLKVPLVKVTGLLLAGSQCWSVVYLIVNTRRGGLPST
jgi:hypothetical protein